MKSKYPQINISATTFQGLSLGFHRKIAFYATILIWIGLAYVGISLGKLYGDHESVIAITALAFIIIIYRYISTGEFLINTIATVLLRITPLGVLYHSDRSILANARGELLGLSSRVNFAHYLDYGKINPSIRSKQNLLVIVHQQKGDLKNWVNNVRNLKQLADFVYQVYLVEEIIKSDEATKSHTSTL